MAKGYEIIMYEIEKKFNFNHREARMFALIQDKMFFKKTVSLSEIYHLSKIRDIFQYNKTIHKIIQKFINFGLIRVKNYNIIWVKNEENKEVKK